MLLSDMLDGADDEPVTLGARGAMGGLGADEDDDDEDEDDEVAADAAEDELMKADINVRMPHPCAPWVELVQHRARRWGAGAHHGATPVAVTRPTCAPC